MTALSQKTKINGNGKRHATQQSVNGAVIEAKGREVATALAALRSNSPR
jgi:hypothetical protein